MTINLKHTAAASCGATIQYALQFLIHSTFVLVKSCPVIPNQVWSLIFNCW